MLFSVLICICRNNTDTSPVRPLQQMGSECYSFAQLFVCAKYCCQSSNSATGWHCALKICTYLLTYSNCHRQIMMPALILKEYWCWLLINYNTFAVKLYSKQNLELLGHLQIFKYFREWLLSSRKETHLRRKRKCFPKFYFLNLQFSHITGCNSQTLG